MADYIDEVDVPLTYRSGGEIHSKRTGKTKTAEQIQREQEAREKVAALKRVQAAQQSAKSQMAGAEKQQVAADTQEQGRFKQAVNTAARQYADPGKKQTDDKGQPQGSTIDEAHAAGTMANQAYASAHNFGPSGAQDRIKRRRV